MSFTRGNLSGEQGAEHPRFGERVQDIAAQTLEVPARTLTALLEKHGVTEIDLLSLDVEGYELEVFGGLDFDRFAPRWILAEDHLSAGLAEFLSVRYDLHSRLSANDALFRLRA